MNWAGMQKSRLNTVWTGITRPEVSAAPLGDGGAIGDAHHGFRRDVRRVPHVGAPPVATILGPAGTVDAEPALDVICAEASCVGQFFARLR
jgi:hypothetical protein